MTEYVYIYYDRILCFRRIKVDDVKGMIDGWMEGGQRRGRTYDRSKFSTKPTEFDDGTPPIAGMSRELWEEHKELLALNARDDGSVLRNGFAAPVYPSSLICWVIWLYPGWRRPAIARVIAKTTGADAPQAAASFLLNNNEGPLDRAKVR